MTLSKQKSSSSHEVPKGLSSQQSGPRPEALTKCTPRGYHFIRMPSAHIKVPRFATHLRLLMLASCKCTPKLLAGHGSRSQVLANTWEAWVELLAPGVSPAATVGSWEANQQKEALSALQIHSSKSENDLFS